MRKKLPLLRVCMFVLCMSLSAVLCAQDRKISGTVKDNGGNPLSGATITLKNSKLIVTTNADGIFGITVPANAKVLVITYVGMARQEVEIGASNVVAVSLVPTVSSLSDVVVVGYGTRRKAEVTSAISSVSEKDLKGLIVAGADQALQGKVAGVSVSSNTGQPGGGVSVRVRGITSVTGGNEPLYVIDGVPILTGTTSTSQDQLGGVPGQNTQSVLATLNPSDIASIDILKDASAQAIYGSLAGNGVVLITTKHGKSGEGKLSYDVYYGWQGLPKKLPLMNLHEYAQYYNSVVGEGTVSGLDSIGEFKNPALLGKGTDWQDAIFKTGTIQNHQLAFSGGQGKTTYYFSGNYFDQMGVVVGSGFKRFAARVSVDQQVKSFLKAGISANMSRTNQQITVTDGQQSVIDLMLYNSPATPVKNFDGSYIATTTIQGSTFGNTTNPVALAMLRDVHAIQSKAFGNIYAELTVAKDFVLRNQLNYDYQLAQNTAFQPNIPYNGIGTQIIGPSRLREDRNTNYYWGLQNYLTYSHTFFGKHAVNILAGHEAGYSHYDNVYNSVTNLTQNIESLSAGTVDPAQTGGQKGDWAQESYIGRISYTYNNKYAVSGSYRRDGSVSFGPGKRWGDFFAGSGAWTVTNEGFAKNWQFVNYLKLRAGYGQVGSSSTGGSNLYSTNIRLVTNANGLFGQPGVVGFPANVGNPFLSWASVNTYNGGVDVTFFKKRIDLTVDVYKKTTTNMLLPTLLPVFAGLDPDPTSSNGFNGSYQNVEPPTTNAGKMTNTGIDISVTSHNIETKSFTWKTSVIFSQYKNTLNNLNAPGASIPGYSSAFTPVLLTLTQSGHSVGSFYGFESDGLFRTMTELNNGITYPLPVSPTGTWLGDVRYKDLNGDKQVDDKDVTFIGNPNPKFTYGITNTFSYKGFDASIFLTGVYGDKIYNYSRMETEALFSVYQNQVKEVLNRYTATNPNGSLPRYNQWNSNNLKISDRFIENGSYLRIQNVSLAYNLPLKWISKAKMTSARVFVTGQNLYTFTKYSGYDPELGSFNGNITRMNIDYGHYPNPRTITVGANIEF